MTLYCILLNTNTHLYIYIYIYIYNGKYKGEMKMFAEDGSVYMYI